jgi:hypothetical protein
MLNVEWRTLNGIQHSTFATRHFASSHGGPLNVASKISGRFPRRTMLWLVLRGSDMYVPAASPESLPLRRTAP